MVSFWTWERAAYDHICVTRFYTNRLLVWLTHGRREVGVKVGVDQTATGEELARWLALFHNDLIKLLASTLFSSRINL